MEEEEEEEEEEEVVVVVVGRGLENVCTPILRPRAGGCECISVTFGEDRRSMKKPLIFCAGSPLPYTYIHSTTTTPAWLQRCFCVPVRLEAVSAGNKIPE